jgi:hypothetical protein
MNKRDIFHSLLRIIIGVFWFIFLVSIKVLVFDEQTEYFDYQIKFSFIVFFIIATLVLIQHILKKKFPDSGLVKKSNFKINSRLVGKPIRYYSVDWLKNVFFSGTDATYFDLMIDGDSFYIIKLPTNHSSAINALAAGLITRKSSWPLIGLIYGGLVNKRERKYYRSNWLNYKMQLIKDISTKDLYAKISLSDFDKYVSFEKNKININFEGETFSLSKETPPFAVVSRKSYITKLRKTLGK